MESTLLNSVLLKNLTPKRENWVIKARVIKKWEVHRRTPPFPVWKTSLMLMDEEGTRIEAYASIPALIERYRVFPREGEVYHFENFRVLPNSKEFSVTDHRHMLMFHLSTKIKETNVRICASEYNFVSVKEIAERSANNNGLIDVIGFLKAFGRLEEQRGDYDTSKRLNIVIADQEENSINVALYGDSAQNAFDKKTADIKPPIVVLLRFAKIARKEGYAHIASAFEATDVFFNPDIPQAKQLMDSICNDPVTSQSLSQIGIPDPVNITPESMLSFKKRFTLAEMKNMEKPEDVVTKVTIDMLETSDDWKYEGCSCDAKPTLMEDSKLVCKKCAREILKTETKFKVHYRVHDSTDSCSIVFFNKVARQLFGKTALDMQQQLEENDMVGSFPLDLSEVIDVEMIVLLRFKPYNKDHPHSSIAVVQYSRDPDILEKFCYTKPLISSSVPEDKTQKVSNGESSTSRVSAQLSDDAFEDKDPDSSSPDFKTPEDPNSKRKSTMLNLTPDSGSLGLTDMSTPNLSSNKSSLRVKKEKKA